MSNDNYLETNKSNTRKEGHKKDNKDVSNKKSDTEESLKYNSTTLSKESFKCKPPLKP